MPNVREPNEESRKRGFFIGAKVLSRDDADREGEIIAWDRDGCPVVEWDVATFAHDPDHIRIKEGA
jgi:hypothetical protein